MSLDLQNPVQTCYMDQKCGNISKIIDFNPKSGEISQSWLVIPNELLYKVLDIDSTL